MLNKGLIGVQMMMLKQKVNEYGAYEVLKKLAELGFSCIEVSQIEMNDKNVSDMKKACADFNIKVAALSAVVQPAAEGDTGEYLTTHFDKIVADCKALNCGFLRIGMLPKNCMASYEGLINFVHTADEMAQGLAKHNIELYYHNHHIEFQKYGGEYILDIIKNEAKHIGFELDVHWIQRGGENPIELIRKYAGCVKLLHLKDYRIAAISLPKDLADKKAFSQAFEGVVQFAEVGEGSLPMKKIIMAGLESGSKYFLIEQDLQYGRDPYDCLVTSRNNLIKMGFEDWFQL